MKILNSNEIKNKGVKMKKVIAVAMMAGVLASGVFAKDITTIGAGNGFLNGGNDSMITASYATDFNNHEDIMKQSARLTKDGQNDFNAIYYLEGIRSLMNYAATGVGIGVGAEAYKFKNQNENLGKRADAYIRAELDMYSFSKLGFFVDSMFYAQAENTNNLLGAKFSLPFIIDKSQINFDLQKRAFKNDYKEENSFFVTLSTSF